MASESLRHRVTKMESLLARPKQHILWVEYTEDKEELELAERDAIAAYEQRTGEKIDERDQKVFLVHWGRVQGS